MRAERKEDNYTSGSSEVKIFQTQDMADTFVDWSLSEMTDAMIDYIWPETIIKAVRKSKLNEEEEAGRGELIRRSVPTTGIYCLKIFGRA